MIRALVAEDSAVTREYLVAILEADPQVSVAGTARDGLEAVERTAELRPDVVLMDVHMPRMDGYAASRQIMRETPTPIVMTSARLTEAELREGFDALEAGALTLLRKPEGPHDGTRSADELVSAVKLMAEIKVVRRWGARRPPASPPRLRDATPPRIVALGASTGGPPVLAAILKALPADYPCPLLVIQHMAAEFSAGFAGWLASATGQAVKLAEAGERPRRGKVYVAPGGTHLGVARDGRLELVPPNGTEAYCPSISRLFASVAERFGAASAGVLLTGMGRDGADGLRRLRDAGAVTIAQDAASSAVNGMPAEAVRLDAAALVLPPSQVARTLRSLVAAEPVR